MQEILPDIHMWSWFSEPHGYNFNGYLIRDGGGNLCIDPVEPGEENLAAIGRAGVAGIILTNRNHSRAANAVRARTHAKTLIHRDDAAHARGQGAEIDGELRAGVKIGPLAVVAARGKSPGEVALHWPDRKILIVGWLSSAARMPLPGRVSSVIVVCRVLSMDMVAFAPVIVVAIGSSSAVGATCFR